VGYLHEFIDCQTKYSLVYDLQEPFRWIADVAVIKAFESGVLNLPDFYFAGDDYRYRFGPEAKHRFLDLLRERFNHGVRYKGRALKWDTVIEQKTNELGRFLNGRMQRLDFTEPTPTLERSDNIAVREAILDLTPSEVRKRGIRKSTLHYLRKKASHSASFQVYTRVLERLETHVG
jgi:CRISPR-associated protein Cas1